MGSEMCIRDSFDDGLVGNGMRQRLAECLVVERRAGHVVAHRHICLLYTSDAADERSSVDLGGRRIITKKIKLDFALRPNIYDNDNSDLP